MNGSPNTALYLYIGLIAAIGMGVGDIILLGQPVSGSHFDIASFGAMEEVNRIRAALASAGGLVCAFLMCFGFKGVGELFADISAKKSNWLFVSLSSMMFFAGTFHAGYFFLANDDGLIHPLVITSFRSYLSLLVGLSIPGALVGSVLFYQLASDHQFSRWSKWCNPVVLNSLVFSICFFVPAPIGGYIKPAFINIASIIFFLVALQMNKGLLSFKPMVQYA